MRADYVTLGQEERYRHRQRSNPNAVGSTYSLDDFARLGVRDITVINPPWRPGSALKNMSLEVLRLDECGCLCQPALQAAATARGRRTHSCTEARCHWPAA